MGVVGWFFAVLLIWIIGFPAYLITRPKYLTAKNPSTRTATTSGPIEAPTAGWYPDPDDPTMRRVGANGSIWGPSEPKR